MSKLKIELDVIKGIRIIKLHFPTDDQKFYQVLSEMFKRPGKKKRKEYFSFFIYDNKKGNLKYIHPKLLMNEKYYERFYWYYHRTKQGWEVRWSDKNPTKYNSFISLDFNNKLKKEFLIILWKFIDDNYYSHIEKIKFTERLNKLFPENGTRI